MPSRIDRILDRLATATALLSGFVIVIMMAMITVDALGRKLGHPVPGGLELSEAMMVATVYLALMSVQRGRENVFVSLVTHNLSPRTQARLDVLAAILALAVFAVLAWIAFGRAWDATLAREYRIAAIEVPIWPFRWFIPLGLVLLCVQLLADAVRDWRASRPLRPDYEPEV